MKRKIAIFAALAMLIGSLAGCTSAGGPDAQESTTQGVTTTQAGTDGEKTTAAPEETTQGEWTGEVDHVIMTYLTLGNTPADLQVVQDAVNEITAKKIGVEVEFKAISAYDAFSQFPTWIATGETVDLMFPLLQDLNTYVSQGLIEPLDSLIAENAPAIQQLTQEGFQITTNNMIDGETWAVSQVPNVFGMGGSYLIRSEYVKEAGITHDPKKIYTLDELTDLFGKMKELHPDLYPCGVVSANRTASEFSYANGIYDPLGAKSFTGVLMGTDSTQVVNLFETEEYKEYLRYLRKWYEAGYIYPDATTTDATNVSLLNSGVTAGYFMASAPVQKIYEDLDQLRLTEIYLGAQGAGGWVIPITSKEPEAAMRFLNLMYADSDLANLIQWGIEGKHYVVVDESINLIGFPEGVDAGTSGYYNTLGLYGDFRKSFIWNEAWTQDKNDAYTAEAMANPTQGVGFVYNPESQSTRITAIQAVVAQYLPSLESGSVDLDTYYPEFIDALKAAGVDEVIADKQQQFDEWRAKQ